MEYEIGRVRENPLNLRALNNFESTPRQFPLELKLEMNILGVLEAFWELVSKVRDRPKEGCLQNWVSRSIDRLLFCNAKKKLEIS